MNYLAHAYLSFDDDEIQLGNLIGDFVKGNKFEQYVPMIKKGILLHRHIDSFTDKHALIHQAVAYFTPHFHLSGAVFVDILFDHFLANDTRYFTQESLQTFTQSVYRNLDTHAYLFNEKMAFLFDHMRKHDWLYHYCFIEGLQRSIHGICKRYPILGDSEKAIKIIDMNYHNLQQCYVDFFPELIIFLGKGGKKIIQ